MRPGDLQELTDLIADTYANEAFDPGGRAARKILARWGHTHDDDSWWAGCPACIPRHRPVD